MSKGLGDDIEKLLKKVGIHDKWKRMFPSCNCDKRKEWLNARWKYVTMTEAQVERMSRLLANYKTSFNPGESEEIYSLYNEIHGTNKRPKSCGPCAKTVFTALLVAYERTILEKDLEK